MKDAEKFSTAEKHDLTDTSFQGFILQVLVKVVAMDQLYLAQMIQGGLSGKDTLGLFCPLGHTPEFASLRNYLTHVGTLTCQVLTLGTKYDMTLALLEMCLEYISRSHSVTFPVSLYSIQMI